MNPTEYRNLTQPEILQLRQQGCSAEDWATVQVAKGIDIRYVRNSRFSGEIRLGLFEKSFIMPGGVKKHSGVYLSTLHNVTVGDNCCIENIKNYIANYDIGHDTFIDNVDIILVDKPSTFGNGIEASVLIETGGREVLIHDKLSAHEAYIEAMYRHRPDIIKCLRSMAQNYAEAQRSDRGTIGSNCMIVDAGYIKNVRVGDYCKIEGAGSLKNGTIVSNEAAPVHIGYGVVMTDFIVQSGSSIEDGVMMSRCFVGQNCKMAHTYSASDSLFFSNCHGENGEACAIFAGPFTVTHHKSTLLIAGMFSFMNAGSGSNQSNHMYKLGPIHQGHMERGAKTSSDSYILWPARIGAFSLVMGRVVGNVDTSDLPFSYLIEDGDSTYLAPAVNLKSVGTIRDAQKWPKRDNRTDPVKLDQINYNLLSPYTMQKALRGKRVLHQLCESCGPTSDSYSFHSTKITNHALQRGLELYDIALTKFFGNSLIQRLIDKNPRTDEEMREMLRPDYPSGEGEWVDLAGLIAPKHEVDKLISDIENGEINTVDAINERFARLHKAYYDMEWTWAYQKIFDFFHLNPYTMTRQDAIDIVEKWIEAVVSLDKMVYADAKKEFSLSAKTGFGADGSSFDAERDFEQVRGYFESNSFVKAVVEHIAKKTALGKKIISQLKGSE
ncbi:MAG: DUF4954 family protein [Bacteroidales bacterium]|nr:DUF4954 family protein [Bacteroidales bacterium]